MWSMEETMGVWSPEQMGSVGMNMNMSRTTYTWENSRASGPQKLFQNSGNVFLSSTMSRCW